MKRLFAIRRLAVCAFVLLTEPLFPGCATNVKTGNLPSGLSQITTRQITSGPGGRILTNTGVWSPDGQWIVYDTRPDPAGDVFTGTRIEVVQVETGQVKVLYESKNGASCGVATFHPKEPKVVFILGPENPTPEWTYSAWHRQGVVVDLNTPGKATPLDACDLTPPFTPGALRGGSHVHVWDGAGKWVSFTYEDHVLAQFTRETTEQEINLRNIGVSIPGRPVAVDRSHPRNHDGSHFSVLVTKTKANPIPGSDEIKRAFEESWVGTNGYVRADGSRQEHALAFQGQGVTKSSQVIAEVFIADLPADLTAEGAGPLAGTESRRPAPPRGTVQRRLTFTADRKHPGLQGPRHWLRTSPDGSRIAFLMKDDRGVVQLWTVSPNGGRPIRLTENESAIASAFSWSPDGRWIAHAMDNSICLTDTITGKTMRVTERFGEPEAPRPEACVFSPDGKRVAWVRPMIENGNASNQIFVTTLQN